ncbi:MAG: response regulator transcription factor [Thermoleophilaceae bacterium]|nr:response regulator transcription factor [Thermoleophilaceae bacterium]
MAERTRQVLIVEDDERTSAFLADNLAADGFGVATATGAAEALRQIEVRQPDVLLLDLGLSAGHGLQVLDGVRSADGLGSRIDPDIPVIVLTGRSGERDRVRGFERGADDFVLKPFSYAELLWRVRALLRRSAARLAKGVVTVGELSVDPATREVSLGGEPIALSPKEFALLHALASDPRRVYPKNELLRDVWGYVSVGSTRTLDAHACRLRKKLGGERWVVSLRGVGYRLTDQL